MENAINAIADPGLTVFWLNMDIGSSGFGGILKKLGNNVGDGGLFNDLGDFIWASRFIFNSDLFQGGGDLTGEVLGILSFDGLAYVFRGREESLDLEIGFLFQKLNNLQIKGVRHSNRDAVQIF